MKKKWKLFWFLLFAVAFVALCLHYDLEDYESLETTIEHVTTDSILFSEQTGVYHKSLSIELDLDFEISNNAQIYYSLDGSDPTTDSNLYTKPVELKLSNDTTIYPLKAVVYQDNEYSDIYEEDYILDPSSKDYDLPIICVTTDPDGLYNEETGIFANYYSEGDEWVRNADLSIFDTDGTLITHQGVGLSVSGGTSVAFDIKSLKITAGYEYDDEDKIYLDLFNDDLEDSSLSLVTEYNSIKLRSGSQDMNYGNIRSSLVSRLAQDSNFDGYTGTQRCVVYLNGELYGIFDMQQNYSNSFLKRRFGLEGTDVITRYKGNEEMCLRASDTYKYFYNDLNDEENREELEEHVDMDNYLLYYAINILDNNTDWPLNNVSAWQYTGDPIEGNEYSDGRLRFLLFDTDLIYYTSSNAHFFDGCDQDQFVSLMNNLYRGKDSTFRYVMESDYYRNKFIVLVCDLLNTSFDTDHILDLIDELYDEVDQPMKDSDLDVYDQADYYISLLKQAVSAREGDIRNDFATYFRMYYQYHSTLLCDDGVKVSWNNMKIYGGESYECDYYTQTSITYQADVYPGYTFEYWLVNGKKYTGDTLVITKDMANQDLTIKAVAKQNAEGQLVISEINAKGDSDWYKFTNVGGSSIHLKDYYITDNPVTLKNYQLPDITLKSGESIIINGKKNYYEMGDYICNFKLNSDETLYLTDGTDLIDSLSVPNLNEDETYGRYLNSNEYHYFNNKNSIRKTSDY